MTGPDFDGIIGGDGESPDRETGHAGGTTGQVHIKKRYGTKTIQANEGCQSCHRNADVAIKFWDPTGEADGLSVKVTLCCFDHLGEVTEGLLRGPFEFELRGFE